MAAPRIFENEQSRMAVDLRRDPATRSGALRRVGDQLGINLRMTSPFGPTVLL